MDLVAIETFCRAVEEGNLTAAAKALNITKSVASRRIQALETDLGVRLLARTTRGVTPTDEGARFFDRCLAILEDLEDAAQNARGDDTHLMGRLRIATPRAFGDMKLADLFNQFAMDNPDLTLEIHMTDERVDLAGGGYDLGLRIARDLTEASLIARKIIPISFTTVASPAYLEAYGAPSGPKDLGQHSAIFYSNAATNKQWSFLEGGTETRVKMDGRILTNSGLLQAEAAIAGLGVATLPRFFVEDALAQGRLVEILSNTQHRHAHLYALYPERRLLPQKVRAFIDFLADWFRDHPAES